MSNSIQFQPDLLQIGATRQLRALLSCTAQGALMAWWILFSHLKELATEGTAAGRVPEGQVELFKKTLEDVARENGIELPEGRTLFDCFREAAVLKPDGPDWVCPRYQVLNVEQRGRGISSLGGNMKSYRSKQEKLESQTMQLGLQIHGDKFVDESGVTLPAELVKRVTRLIIACDNALYKPARPPAGFTEGLIQTALQIVRAHTDEDIDYVCETVALHRAHPRLLGLNTERLLPEFGNMVRSLKAD